MIPDARPAGSVYGNELATRFGRRRMLTLYMLLAAAFAALLGFSAALPFWLTVAAPPSTARPS